MAMESSTESKMSDSLAGDSKVVDKIWFGITNAKAASLVSSISVPELQQAAPPEEGSKPGRAPLWGRGRGPFGCRRQSSAPKPVWNKRHQVLFNSRGELLSNQDFVKSQRCYFHEQLKGTEMAQVSSESPPGTPGAHVDPRVSLGIPQRHNLVPHGTMLDRSAQVRAWNTRWQTGIYLVNEKCYKNNRDYFAHKSKLETMPGHAWRRLVHQEAALGVWQRNETYPKPLMFPSGANLDQAGIVGHSCCL